MCSATFWSPSISPNEKLIVGELPKRPDESNNTGTEVSGILGFAMLRMLNIKLDYRDGLVDFEFKPLQ
jgi:hypothetical protein